MSRRQSFWMLVGTVLVVGVCLLQVVRTFLLPLFLALVLALLFRPAYERMIVWSGGRRRIAALCATCAVLLMVILPITAVMFLAGQQLIGVAKHLVPEENAAQAGSAREHVLALRAALSADEFSELRQAIAEGKPATAALSLTDPDVGERLDALDRNFSPAEVRAELESTSVADVFSPEKSAVLEEAKERFARYVPPQVVERLGESLAGAVGQALTAIYRRTQSFLSDAFSAVVGFAVMAVALYYFLADGPDFARTLKSLVPLERLDEEILFRRFEACVAAS